MADSGGNDRQHLQQQGGNDDICHSNVGNYRYRMVDGKRGKMIKAETKTKGENSVTKVSFEGEANEIIAELCEVLAKGADAVTSMIEEDGKEVTYEKAFYAIVMTAIDTAKEDGFEIDSRKLGLALMIGKEAINTK